MVSLAIPSQVCSQVGTRESIERKPWTSAARNDVVGFLAQSCGLVGGAIFLYALGPALGMTLLAVGLVVWSFLRGQVASEEDHGLAEDDGHAAAPYAASRCADPVWMGSGRFGMSAAAATRPVQRQGV